MARPRSIFFFLSTAILHCAVLAQLQALKLCNTTYSDRVNGSGTVVFDPGIRTAQDPDGSFQPADYTPINQIPDATWLVTTQQLPAHKTSAISTFWFNTGGEEYWNDEQTLFDACAFVFSGPFPNNTVYLSQNDPGDCSVMLTSECRSALLQKAVSEATLLTGYATPPPYSNLSAGVLPYLCEQMGNNIVPFFPDSKDHTPKECWNDFNVDDVVGPEVQVLALTGNNRSTYSVEVNNDSPTTITGGLDYDCPTFADDGRKFYYSATYGYANDYDFAMRQAWLILSVFFQVANEEVLSVSNPQVFPTARLSCPRVTKYSTSTEEPARLPSGTPTSHHIPGSGIHLSTSVIIGIVLGCVLGTFLIISAIVICWRRRTLEGRREKAYADKERALAKIAALEREEQNRKPAELNTNNKSSDTGESGPPELHATDTQELDPTFRRPEIEGYQLVELPSPTAELHGHSASPSKE